MRLETRHHEVRDPVKEPGQVEVRDDEHHREQEHDRAEVDVAQRVPGLHDAERHHQHRADDTRTGSVDLHPRKLA